MIFKTNLKIGWRNLARHKFFSLVNVAGLSVGIAFVMLIGGYVWRQLEVNKHLTNVNDLYLVQCDWNEGIPGADFKSPLPLVEALKRNYPDLVANYYRHDFVSTIVSIGDKQFRDSLQIGDTTLLSMFGFPLLYGDKAHLFDLPEALVLTASKARKFFGKTDVIGRILAVDNFHGRRKEYVVTGVLKEIPQNSVTYSIYSTNPSVCSIFLGITQMTFIYNADKVAFDDWDNRGLTSYLQLQKGVSPAALYAPIQKLIKDHDEDNRKGKLRTHLAPLNTFNLDANNGINKKMITVLSVISLFILLMAVVNFINISIGTSSSRLKEIGIRKVLGSMRKELIGQFLMESMILVSIAVLVSFVIYIIARPLFIEIIGQDIPQLHSFPRHFILLPILLIPLLGFLAGIYPAFILSGINPIGTIKGKLQGVRENILLKKTLVGFQFSIATIVFISAVIITSQVSYFLNTDLGFNKEQLISIFLPRDWSEQGVRHMETVRNELAQTPGVVDGSISYSMPNRNTMSYKRVFRQDRDSLEAVSSNVLVSDEKYAQTFQIPVVAGAFFDNPTRDSLFTSIVVNESAVKALGWTSPDKAIGAKVKMTGETELYTIAGVVKDYHYASKREAIKPLLFFNVHNWTSYRFLTLKIQAGRLPETMEAIQKKWTLLLPSTAFDYSFMDESITKAYQSEIQLKRASFLATVLAIFIVLLGVVGIVSLSIAKRFKEVGIRKVLGASELNIITIFLKEFLLIIAVGNLVAWPVVFMIMRKWLDNYAYRIDINLFTFGGVACALTLFILFIITLQTLKAARVNPVNSLRSE